MNHLTEGDECSKVLESSGNTRTESGLSMTIVTTIIWINFSDVPNVVGLVVYKLQSVKHS